MAETASWATESLWVARLVTSLTEILEANEPYSEEFPVLES